MKAGIATIALRNYDVFSALDMASDAGFAGVEIWGKPPHTPEGFDEDHTRRVRDRARANGLAIPTFGSYVNPCLPDFQEKSDEAVEIALGLGAKIVRIWAGNKEPHDAPEDLWQHVATSLHEFALRAADEGLTLAMEMHGGTLCLTPEGALRVVEMADADNLKLNYQVNSFAEPDVEHDLGLVGGLVVMVHAQSFKKSCCDPTKTERSLVQCGAVDYDKVCSLLAQHGFKGYVEVEFLKGEFDSEDALIDSLKKDAAYLKMLTEKYTAA